MDFRRKIDGVEVVAKDDEVWFLQESKICWTTREEIWSGSSRLVETLRRKGYTVQVKNFPKKLRELVLSASKLP